MCLVTCLLWQSFHPTSEPKYSEIFWNWNQQTPYFSKETWQIPRFFVQYPRWVTLFWNEFCNCNLMVTANLTLMKQNEFNFQPQPYRQISDARNKCRIYGKHHTRQLHLFDIGKPFVKIFTQFYFILSAKKSPRSALDRIHASVHGKLDKLVLNVGL